MINNRVNSVGSISSPPLSPATAAHHGSSSRHSSPPSKKRRSASGAHLVSGSSPPGGISTSSIMAAPTSSSPPHRDGFPVSELENHIGPPHHVRDSPALTSANHVKSVPSALTSHSDLVVTPLGLNSRPPPLKALPNATSSTHGSPDAPDGVEIKFESTEVKQEDPQAASPDEAVNLVTEGSILRQRIQGLRASPDSPYVPSSRASLSHEDSSMDERFMGQDGRNDYERDGRIEYDHDGRYDYDRDGRIDFDRENFTDHDRDAVLSSSPMVIRSSLAGLLPRDAPGKFSKSFL